MNPPRAACWPVCSWRRLRQFDDDAALLAVSGAAIGVIAWLGMPSARQAARVAAAVVLGFGAVLLSELFEALVMW